MLLTILTIVLVLIAIAMTAIILVQRGAGATTGAAFGSGASGTVFGAQGSASFLSRTTSVLAVAFFTLALLMAVLVNRGYGLPDADDSSIISADPINIPADVPGAASSDVEPPMVITTDGDVPAADTSAGAAEDIPDTLEAPTDVPADIPAAEDVPAEAAGSETDDN